MIDANFRRRLVGGETLIGTMLSLASPAVAEVLANTTIDWLFVDAEHGTFSTGDIQSVLQAAGRNVPCLVRVEAPQELPIKKALDAGAAGVIVPAVNSAETAAQMVSFARYSPAGSRGVGLARAHGYGKTFGEYLETANDRLSLVVQAEHVEAVENIDRIVGTEGIDSVLVGPYDLSASLGKMGQLDDPQVSPAAVRPYMERGFTLIVVGVDTMLLNSAAESMLAELQ